MVLVFQAWDIFILFFLLLKPYMYQPYLQSTYTILTKYIRRTYDVPTPFIRCTKDWRNYKVTTTYQRRKYDIPTSYYVRKLSRKMLLTSYLSCFEIVWKMQHINFTLSEVRWPLTEFKSLVYSFIQMHFSKSIQ